jgi:hypothetical protein
MECPSQTTCIGALNDPLHLVRGVCGTIVAFIPLYLLAGSCGGIVWIWLGSRKPKSEKSYKMSCHSCGTHIEFNKSNLGQNIPCPNCQAVVNLRRPGEYLKMSCFFCQGYIEFPACALGTKLNCPLCNREIILKQVE